jgi:hypothetical protein
MVGGSDHKCDTKNVSFFFITFFEKLLAIGPTNAHPVMFSLTQLLHVSASLVHHQGMQLYKTVISAQQAKEVYQFKHVKERFIKPINIETVVYSCTP